MDPMGNNLDGLRLSMIIAIHQPGLYLAIWMIPLTKTSMVRPLTFNSHDVQI
jgi:hypothetical protein